MRCATKIRPRVVAVNQIVTRFGGRCDACSTDGARLERIR
jgi:hypothetical protein